MCCALPHKPCMALHKLRALGSLQICVTVTTNRKISWITWSTQTVLGALRPPQSLESGFSESFCLRGAPLPPSKSSSQFLPCIWLCFKESITVKSAPVATKQRKFWALLGMSHHTVCRNCHLCPQNHLLLSVWDKNRYLLQKPIAFCTLSS